jgi:indolepyruvate ferredoxin oxidoreductase
MLLKRSWAPGCCFLNKCYQPYFSELIFARRLPVTSDGAVSTQEIFMALRNVTLNDKFDLGSTNVYLSGTQAIVRMLLMQQARDKAAGLNTAGFVSGYRGSPLGGLDQQLWRARKELGEAGVVFQPGLNEELAATAVWGTQQTGLYSPSKYDGVFGMWYGKGPGVDRSGDVFRHANLAGTSKNGGVLALMGDDHNAESSTNAHQTEFLFLDIMMPILNPAGVQEILDYGQIGYALSRYASTWVAFKCVKDNIESTASVDASIDHVQIKLPELQFPDGGINIRAELDFLGQEARLHEHKRAAASAFVAQNNLNRIIYSGGANAKLGIVTIGKSYLDTRQALDDLGIDESRARDLGIRLFKVGCAWPFDAQHFSEFTRGLETVIVVEEKRTLLEVQMKEHLYGTANQPLIVGKRDERGAWLFPVKGSLDPNEIAIAIGVRVLKYIGASEEIAARVHRLKQYQAQLADTVSVATRTPYFCSGCPHNSSTKVPEGSRAAAGIGCHFMALWMDRGTHGFTQMGGEGAQWVGEAPFTETGHIFQNLGDGTYNHSGSLAIRFALSSKVNITYKILYNDAVAMTGGQPHEGGLKVDEIARQVRAEGVERIAIVTDDMEKYAGLAEFPARTTVHGRDDLELVQLELRDVKGVSVLIFDQTCAAEKRRRRKRGTYPDPDKRIIINELVCEGCGDCGVASNCVSVQPEETEFGRKRKIDQTSCNKDFSCVNGFCPSFVTVHGAKLKKAEGLNVVSNALDGVPEPKAFNLDQGWAAVINGVGGTGIVTIASILGMAAHLEGKGCGMIDMAGLAQKGGAVFSHMRIAKTPADISAIRVSAGKADLILGCDLVVSGAKTVLAAARENHTLFVANTAEIMPGDFTRHADYSLPVERLKRAIGKAAGAGHAHFFDATETTRALFGNTVAANMFMLGYAFQHGGVPLSAEAVEKAIVLNSEAVKMNIDAFQWGRRAAHEPDFVRAMIAEAQTPKAALSTSLDEIIAKRAAFLSDYQNAAYAALYIERLEAITVAEARVHPGSTALTETAARSLFKLMAVKDEYEVARLYTNGAFAVQLGETFSSYDKLEFHLAPPVFSSKNAKGHMIKRRFGGWMLKAFGILAQLKILRGTVFDVFGYSAERRMERGLSAAFELDLALAVERLTADNFDDIKALLALPMDIRGYGHVKHANVEKAKTLRRQLLEGLSEQTEPLAVAAE